MSADLRSAQTHSLEGSFLIPHCAATLVVCYAAKFIVPEAAPVPACMRPGCSGAVAARAPDIKVSNNGSPPHAFIGL